jgi:hypothetical protein
MDILNWLYLVKNKFTRTTIENPATDLMVLGADVSFQKRGDKYQNYAVPVSGIVPLVYSTGTVAQETSIADAVTLNTYSGVIETFSDVTNFIPAGTIAPFRVNNSNVTTASIIHVTLQDSQGAGELIFATVGRIANGYFDVVLNNASLNDTTGPVYVHFSVVNITV